MSTPLLESDLLRRLDRLRLRPRRILNGSQGGDLISRRFGSSLEFADYREYQPGDDIRSVDWSLYSRLDRLFVRLYAEEQNVHVDLLIDASRSMTFGQPTKLDYARRLAAALGYIALQSGDAVTPLIFGEQLIGKLGRLHGRHAIGDLFRFLQDVTPSQGTSLRDALTQRGREAPGKGMAIILSDMLDTDQWQEGVRALSAAGREVYLVHLISPSELRPDVVGDFEWIDAESDDRLALTVDDAALDLYAEALEQWLGELRAFCMRHQVVYLRVDTSIPLQELLVLHLRRGGLLHG